MSEQTVTGPPIVPAEQAPTDIAQPPAAQPEASSPAPEAPPVVVRPETIQLATLDVLLNKKRRTDTFVTTIDTEDEEGVKIRFELQALTGPEYDQIVADCPPTRQQSERQLSWNPDEFEPALAAAVISEPNLTAKQWGTVRKSEAWSGGEWASLVLRCQNLCMRGLDIPFNSLG